MGRSPNQFSEGIEQIYFLDQPAASFLHEIGQFGCKPAFPLILHLDEQQGVVDILQVASGMVFERANHVVAFPINGFDFDLIFALHPGGDFNPGKADQY